VPRRPFQRLRQESTDPGRSLGTLSPSRFRQTEIPRQSRTPNAFFRGFTADGAVGPYVSQFLLKPFNYGQIPISGQIITFIPGIDHMTTPSLWMSARNGCPSPEKIQNDLQIRHIRNGRDLAAYVRTRQVFQAFCNAGIWLFGHGAEQNPGNPCLALAKQASFATFGPPHFLTLLAEASNRALKAAFYGKWFVHRTLRPEEYGGLVHMTKTRQADYPLHPDVLESRAIAETFSPTGSYLRRCSAWPRAVGRSKTRASTTPRAVTVSSISVIIMPTVC
jgi:hypothetical protein